MNDVLVCDELEQNVLKDLLHRYQLQVVLVKNKQKIPGSWWGDSEAGLMGNTLYIRNDTPVHSALHEACHFICMDSKRRHVLNTDANGDYDEENAVCFLQIILADFLTSFGRHRILQDMDRWGYSFRLGSAEKWFYEDADEVIEWLLAWQLIDDDLKPTWQKRV